MERDNMNEPWLPPHTRQATKALAILLFYSFLMFSLPFGVFFGVKYYLKDHFNVDGFQNTVWSVLAAVVTVNLIIMLYAYQAYHEKEYDDHGIEITDQSSLKQD